MGETQMGSVYNKYSMGTWIPLSYSCLCNLSLYLTSVSRLESWI